jgi:hypothetical protein
MVVPINRKILIQASLGKKGNTLSKMTSTERAKCVAQMVKCLLTKHKALSSNSSITKNK